MALYTDEKLLFLFSMNFLYFIIFLLLKINLWIVLRDSIDNSRPFLY